MSLASFVQALFRGASPASNIKFGVHNHYNNNADGTGDWFSPEGTPLISELEVRVTNKGIVIFNLKKTLDIEEKVTLAKELNVELRKQFGHGLSFAMSAFSDGFSEDEWPPFINAMKEINPAITTIFSTQSYEDGNDWIEIPDNTDHTVNQWGATPVADAIAEIVNKGMDERESAPNMDWTQFTKQVNQIFNNALAKTQSLGMRAPAGLNHKRV